MTSPDPDRVRTRAFFLWKNRTGRAWADCLENWKEAYEHELALLQPRFRTPVAKYAWPYKVHFTEIASLSKAAIGESTPPRRFDCTVAELRSLRDAYNRIALAAAQYDYVCAFACGAVALLQWIAVEECHRLFGCRAPRTELEAATLQYRLHLFPGLSWAKDSEVAFLVFLASAPKHSRIMVVDCSFTGGAVAAAANAAASLEVGQRVALFAVVDRHKLDDHKLANVDRLRSEGRIGSVVLQEVDSLLAEDFPELLGYDALQESSTLAPLWRPGVVTVRDTSTNRYHVRSSHPLHTVFRDLLSGAHPLTCDVAQDNVNKVAAETLYFVLRNMLATQYGDIVADECSRDAGTFLKAKGQLCAQWRRRVRGLATAFGVAADQDEPEFCATIQEDRAILRGKQRTVRLHESDGGVLVSLRCAFTDAKRRSRIDFSFELDESVFHYAQEHRLTLPAIVPDHMLPDFAVMWKQQARRHQVELLHRWNIARDEYDHREE